MSFNFDIYEILEKSDTPFIFIVNDTIKYSNQAFASLVGYNLDIIKNISYKMFFPEENLLEIFNKKVSEGRVHVCKLIDKHTNIKLVAINLLTLKNNSYFMLLQDITQSQLENKQIFEAKKYVDSLFSNQNDGVIVVDTRCQVFNINNAALSYGMHKVKPIINNILNNYQSKNIHENSFEIIDFKGNSIYLKYKLKRILIRNTFEFFIINILDITQNVLLEKELKSKNDILHRQYVRIDKEIGFARNVQEKILPNPLFVCSKMTVVAKNRIANAMGGDYYNMVKTIYNNIYFGVYDVSGHGVASSLIVMQLEAMLRGYDKQYLLESNDIFYYLQKQFTDKIPGKHFVAATVVVFDQDNLSINYTCGGSYAPIIIHKNGTVDYFESAGFAIGFIKNPDYKSTPLQLSDNDKILLYTDGIIEANDINGNIYGKERLLESLKRHYHDPPLVLLNNIYKDLIDYINSEDQQDDDLTLMIAHIKDHKISKNIPSLPALKDYFRDILTREKINFIESDIDIFWETNYISGDGTAFLVETYSMPEYVIIEIFNINLHDDEEFFQNNTNLIDAGRYSGEDKYLYLEILKNSL